MHIDFAPIRKSAFYSSAPDAIKALTNAAFNSIRWGMDWDEEDFFTAESMVRDCIDLMHGQQFDGDTWLLALMSRIDSEKKSLETRWPSRYIEHDGRLFGRGISTRLFASIALWRITIAATSLEQGDYRAALVEIANAGIAMFFAGIEDGETHTLINRSHTMKRASGKRWAGSPYKSAKAAVLEIWPEAKRKGWTAERLWTALRDKGHDVKPDTVRKWTTRLRKSGTC